MIQVEVGKHYLSEIARVFYDKVIDDPQTIEIMCEASYTNDLKKNKLFLEHLIDINNEAAYLFLVNNDLIRKKVFEDEQNNYLQSDTK